MAGEELAPLKPAPVAGLRLGIPQGMLLQDFDNTVGTRFGAAKKKLADAGVRLTDEPMPLFDEMLAVNAKGGFAPAEAYRDPSRASRAARQRVRSERARAHRARRQASRAADYVEMMRERARLVARDGCAGSSAFDALVLPTTPIVAPTIAEMQDTHTFNTKNMLLLRNTADVEFLRHVRDLDPHPGLRTAGRADAGRAQRPRPPPVRDRGRHRAAVCRVSGAAEECYKP